MQRLYIPFYEKTSQSNISEIVISGAGGAAGGAVGAYGAFAISTAGLSQFALKQVIYAGVAGFDASSVGTLVAKVYDAAFSEAIQIQVALDEDDDN